MQEQNFEKQVQQKMEEFSLTPSAPVWQKVEKEIRQKKERRRLIVFWLLPFVVIGAGVLWWTHKPFTQKEGLAGPSSLTTTQSLPKSSTFPTETSVPASVSAKRKASSTATTTFPQLPTRETGTITNQEIASTEVEHAKKETTLEKQAPAKEQQKRNKHSLLATAFHTQQKGQLKRRKEKDPIASATEDQTANTTTESTQSIPSQNSQPQASSSIIATEENQTTTPSLSKTMENETKLNDLKQLTDSAQTKKKQKKTAKWTWTIQASYGISSLKKDLLTSALGTPQVLSEPLNGTSVSGPVSPTVAPSPSIDKGMGYQFSFLLKRTITKRLLITSGLQYTLFTTKNNTGASIEKDTTVKLADFSLALTQYYRNTLSGSTQTYKNKYHFIELPIGVEWQVAKNLPLKLQTGVSLSYLIASNALVYDNYAKIYYQNKGLLSKTQIHFFSGLTYPVWTLHHTVLHLGPYLQYGITGIEKEKSKSNHHLLSTGVKMQLSF